MNLRPLGYEHNLMMAGPFVSKHLVRDDVRFWPLFSNFCDHFVSKKPQKNGTGQLAIRHPHLTPCDFFCEIGNVDLDAIPATWSCLTTIRPRPPSGTGWAAEEQAQRAARNRSEGGESLGFDSETQMIGYSLLCSHRPNVRKRKTSSCMAPVNLCGKRSSWQHNGAMTLAQVWRTH